MLDAPLRKLIDRPLAMAAARLVGVGVSANPLTIVAFGAGLAGAAAIATRHSWIGLAFIVLNRLLDGLDGAVARRTQSTDLGAFLDIAFDFIFYASIPFAFALADPTRALAATFLIFSFVGTGTTFLAYAVFAEKRGLKPEKRGQRSLYYLGGLTEGSETLLAFGLACLFPDWFSVVAYIFGTLCFLTTGTRVAAASLDLRDN